MSKVIKIRTKEYNDCMEELKDKLLEFQEKLFLCAINLATNGVWLHWHEEQEKEQFLMSQKQYLIQGTKTQRK